MSEDESPAPATPITPAAYPPWGVPVPSTGPPVVRPAAGTTLAVPIPPATPPLNPYAVHPARPLFGERWTGPQDAPSRRMLAAAVASGVAAAVALPDGPRGVGWFVTALVAAVSLVLVARASPRNPLPAVDLAWAGAALALAAVGTVRDAGWLDALCLLAACGAGSIAVAGNGFRGVVAGALAVPVAALRSVAWLRRSARTGRSPIGAARLRLAVSLIVGLIALAVFAPLLVSADAAFAHVLDDLVPTVDGGSLTRWVVLFCLAGVGVLGGSFLLAAPPPLAVDQPVRPSRLRKLEWALPVGLVTALFALFVGVQFATLFGGDGYVLRTTGLTYAEYARSGFWQLLAVTVLALGVIMAGSRFAPELTASDRAWKRGLLAALACNTLVIVASATSRMWLYQQAYGFTVQRLIVLTCELWLGVAFLLVLGAVLRLNARGLTRGIAAAGTAALLGLAVLNPEGFIAAHNVARLGSTGQLDDAYLATLSNDAVPALDRLPEPVRSCVLARIAAHNPADAGWQGWTVAGSLAAGTLPGAAVCRN
ncbi:DUF4153 domain-containing protein [Pseudonocardia sp. GCM10023141]|uniref:DUF4153 domain-containing protein n=1 Tax=Pseudonocardia sp. GCM10023141 TaxID=3252653 RepID=UPI003615E266